MSDIWTMVWKEWRDAIFPGGKLENFRPLIFIASPGNFLAIDRQAELADTLSLPMVLLSVCFPYFFILNYIGDAFAGERERHTLETLLASRISDRAILLGKVIATVGYIWGMTLIASFAGVVVVNLAKGTGAVDVLYPGQWLAGSARSLSMLACLLAASGGILVSLHSATARQAQQTLLLGSLALFVAIYFLVRVLPPQVFVGLSNSQLLLIVMLVLVVLDAILLAISMASFHRSRLILS